MSASGRREWMAGVVGASFFGRWLGGCEGEEVAPEVDGALLGPDLDRGHALRDAPPGPARFRDAPVRRVPVVIAGGGVAGLAAAWRLRRRGLDAFEVLELEDVVGGTARGGHAGGIAFPWGAHYLPLPFGDQPALIAALGEMGALEGADAQGDPVGAEHCLVREPEERVFHRGFWYPGLFLHAGAAAEDRAELARLRAAMDALAARRDARGRRAFAIPLRTGADDPDLAPLDRITAAEWLDREGFRSPRVRWLVDYGCRDDYGVGAAHASAWAALFYHAARVRAPGEGSRPLLAWPEGNAALIAHLARAVGEARLRPRSLVVDVRPHDAGVRVSLLRDGRPEVIEAERVVVALPRYVARRVVADPGAPAWDPPYGAWLVANLTLTGRPASRGFPAAWDNVLYDGPSLGYVVATHQSLRDHGPTVWTYYLPLVDEDPKVGRQKLHDGGWADWKELVVRDLRRAHPDLERHLARVDVWRWGHAMVQARPGVISDPARRRAAAPLGRVHFAHSDLSGMALCEEAFDHGVRAADEVLAARAPAEVRGAT